MSIREKHLRAYIKGWRSMDIDAVLSSLTDDFVFHDQVLVAPVKADRMADFMRDWKTQIEGLSNGWDYEDSDEVIKDQDGVLLRWKWWQFLGTNIQGSAVTKTTDVGMVYELLPGLFNTASDRCACSVLTVS